VNAGSSNAVRLSVIIPTLNEARHIEATLAAVGGYQGVETIVVDGGSRDNTVALAAGAGARVARSPRGRARQMNQGARAAAGTTLLFLHADTRLPPGYPDAIARALARPGIAAGAFRLRIAGGGWGLRLVEWGANWRSRSWGLPYGDQALFLPAVRFQQLGGFPEVPIMEDYLLVKRLGRKGKVITLREAVCTSPRRWLRLGIWRTTMLNQAIVLGHAAGVDPRRLARWYGRMLGRGSREDI